jgi:hypothetical protein
MSNTNNTTSLEQHYDNSIPETYVIYIVQGLTMFALNIVIAGAVVRYKELNSKKVGNSTLNNL